MHVLRRCMSAAAIYDRAATAAQTAAVASQVAAATSGSGITNGESGTVAVRSAATALALMGAAHDHVEAAHAQLVAVTEQIERSFSDNGRQPTAEELAITGSVRAAVRSSVAYLTTTEPVQAQIAATHAQLVAAFPKRWRTRMARCLPSMVQWMPWSPFPRRPSGASWTWKRRRRSTSTSHSSTLCFV